MAGGEVGGTAMIECIEGFGEEVRRWEGGGGRHSNNKGREWEGGKEIAKKVGRRMGEVKDRGRVVKCMGNLGVVDWKLLEGLGEDVRMDGGGDPGDVVDACVSMARGRAGVGKKAGVRQEGSVRALMVEATGR